MRAPYRMSLLIVLALVPVQLAAQTLLDPGFEGYNVVGGGLVKPDMGPWLFANDAGVVEPLAPNSSTGSGNTWSATWTAFQGEQYASTYAALDSLRQVVTFHTPGDYTMVAQAAAPSGTLLIPEVGMFNLGDGEFTFILNNTPIGITHTIAAGSDWQYVSAGFNIPTPGDYTLGVRNTKVGSYFINYDAFAIVPEPSSWILLGMVLGVLCLWILSQEPGVARMVHLRRPSFGQPRDAHVKRRD